MFAPASEKHGQQKTKNFVGKINFEKDRMWTLPEGEAAAAMEPRGEMRGSFGVQLGMKQKETAEEQTILAADRSNLVRETLGKSFALKHRI